MSPRLLRGLSLGALCGLFLLAGPAPSARAQAAAPSAGKAFARSLVVPGWGHRYAHGGRWHGAASAFALADAGLWLGLLGTEVRRAEQVEAYTTFAAARADADVDGKNRTFFLNLAAYPSSDAYREAKLRQRAWNEIDYVADRSFQWAWETDDAFRRFQALRDDAESLRRRRTGLVAALVANRLVSGLLAARAARRAEDVTLGFAAPPPGADLPMLQVRLGL